MERVDIYTLLHHKNSDISFARYNPETLEGIAAEQGRTVEAIAEAIYRIASWLEDMGNRGIRYNHLDKDLPKEVLQKESHTPAWDSILFENKDGEWYARKRPHWTLAWGWRYGWETEIGQNIIAAHHDDALVIHQQVLEWIEARKPKRAVPTIAGRDAEEIPTIEVALVAAVAFVLYRRYMEKSGHGLSHPNGILRWHYQELHEHANAELLYRTQSAPKERSSKKKTKAAVEGWKQARALLDAGVHHFYSKAFIEQAVHSAEEPDLEVDYEHLPKLPLDETPIRWLSDREVQQQFMKWVDAEADPASFEYEDKQLIMRQLRTQFARVMGQKPDDEDLKLTATGEGDTP